LWARERAASTRAVRRIGSLVALLTAPLPARAAGLTGMTLDPSALITSRFASIVSTNPK
jgi:hypothetical protein